MDGCAGQGCSTLFTESHGKDGFETAERCGVAVLADRIGLRFANPPYGLAETGKPIARDIKAGLDALGPHLSMAEH